MGVGHSGSLVSSHFERLSSDFKRLSSDLKCLSSDSKRPASDFKRLFSDPKRLSSDLERPSNAPNKALQRTADLAPVFVVASPAAVAELGSLGASQMNVLRKFSLFIAIIAMAGCASTDYVASSKYPPRSVDSVETLFQEPSRPYEVIAFVEATTVTIFDTPAKLVRQAREQAAAAGADAVIFSTTGKWSGMPGAPGTASGRAIRWKSR